MPPLLPVTEMRNDNLDRGVIRRGRRQSPVVVIVVNLPVVKRTAAPVSRVGAPVGRLAIRASNGAK